MELQLKKQCLLMFLLLIGLLLSSPNVAAKNFRTDSIYQRVLIKITNSVLGDSPVTIHCKSKNDDMGTKVVPLGGSYEFSFHPNLFPTTLFFCGFTSSHGSVEFNVYDEMRDNGQSGGRCTTECDWMVNSFGVYGFRQGHNGGSDICFGWNNQKC